MQIATRFIIATFAALLPVASPDFIRRAANQDELPLQVQEPARLGNICELYVDCLALNLTGECCPSIDNVTLDCCGAPRACQANSFCADEGLTGLCCPSEQGIMLDCCTMRAPPMPAPTMDFRMCEDIPACAARNLTGNCCQTVDNVTLDCCEEDVRMCEFIPACAALNLTGDCCTTIDNVTLDCCME